METQIIQTHNIGPRIVDLVQAAQRRVVLVSPYWKLWGHLDLAIKQAAQKKASVEIVFREDKTEEYRDLKTQLHAAGARVSTIPFLHAKVYHSESACILTSINLLDFSAQNSEEFALYTTDPHLLQAVTAYTDGLLKRAKELKAPSTAARIFQGVASAAGTVGAVIDAFKPGICIRCGKAVAFNPDSPMCEACYASWSRYKNRDYVEKYCHDCGGQKQTTIARPVCLACYKAGK